MSMSKIRSVRTVLPIALALSTVFPPASVALRRALAPALPTTKEAFLEKVKQQNQQQTINGIHRSEEIPTNFPLPIYKSNVVSTTFQNSTRGPVAASAMIITRDPVSTVYQWYQTQCSGSGWTMRTPKASAMSAQETKGKLYILNASKDKQVAMIFCAQTAKDTVVNISWAKKK